MKTRQGFVSNSSSSSFIVKYKYEEKNKLIKLLTNEQLKKLKNFGFKYTLNNNPYFVGVDDYNSTNLKHFKQYDRVNLSYDVTCNQDDVIYFLLRNQIPFVALCHYEQELVVWDGKSEFFYEMPNILELVNKDIGKKTFDCGQKYQYHPVQLSPPIKKYNVKEWIIKERKYIESLI